MNRLVGGLDEVGYGSWAGPIISVVAVFRNEDLPKIPAGVTDSKKTSELQRRTLYLPLCQLAYDVGIGHAWPWEIDSMGVSPALQLCYRRALTDLRCEPEMLLVDGSNRVQAWRGHQLVEPKADFKYQQVSAASMIAKHFRDTIMIDYAKTFPQYDFANNKGYGSASHEQAIFRHGLLIDETNHARYLHRRIYTRKVMLRKPECQTT
jgi:ribonuclease HII